MDIPRITKARLYIQLYTKLSEICKLLTNNDSLTSKRLLDLNNFLNTHLMVVINPIPYEGDEVTLRFWMNMEYSLRKGLSELNYIKLFRIKCPRTLPKEQAPLFYDCLDYVRKNIRTLKSYYPYLGFVKLFIISEPLEMMGKLYNPSSDIFITNLVLNKTRKKSYYNNE